MRLLAVVRLLSAMVLLLRLLLLSWLGCVCLAQEDAPAPPAAPDPLVLFPNDVNACNAQAFHSLTLHYRSCAKAFYKSKDPDEDCCQGLVEYYGLNTTRPSGKCYCDAQVWTDFIKYEESHYYSFSDAFLICTRMGFPVPYNAEEGVGYCYGVPPTEEALQGAMIEGLSDAYIKTAKAYVSNLHYDDLVSFAFATSIVSGVGMLLLLWPLLWESAISVYGAVKRQ